MAAASISSPRTLPQLAIPRLVVRTMLVLRWRWLMTLEQGGRGVGGQGQVAELVDDEQRRVGEQAHSAGPAAFDRCPVTAGGEVGGGGEVGAVAGFGGLAGKADRDVGCRRRGARRAARSRPAR